MKRISKLFLSVSIVFISLAILSLVGGVLWVASSPRSLPILTENIEKRLNTLGTNYRFAIEDTIIRWDGWEENLSIHVKDLTIKDTGKDIAIIPDVTVSLDMGGLFVGDIIFEDLQIIEPEIAVDIAREGEIVTYGDRKYHRFMEKYFAAVVKVLLEIDTFGSNTPIKNIGIIKGRVTLKNGVEEIPWNIPEALLSVNYVRGFPAFISSIELFDAATNRRSFLSIKAKSLNDIGKVSIETEVTNIASAYVADVLPDLGWLREVDVNLSGKANILINGHGIVDNVEFQILSQAESGLDAGVSGNLKIYPEYKGYLNVPVGNAVVRIRDVQVNDLNKYWPPNIGQDARDWTLDSISEGSIEELNANITFSPEAYINGDTEKHSIKGRMKFSDIRVEYIKGLPEVDSAAGTAHFNSEQIIFNVEKSIVKSSEASGTVAITDIDSDNITMSIDLNTLGKIADIKPFVEWFTKDTKKRSNPVDFQHVRGSIDAYHSYSFPLRDDLNFSDIVFSGGGKVTNVFLPSVMNNLDISQGKFDLSVDNRGLKIDGSAYLNTTLANIKWAEDFSNTKKYSTEYLVASYITPEEFTILGGPKLPNVKGTMSAKLSIKQNDEVRDVVAKIDLKDTNIEIPSLGFNKAVGEYGNLELYVEDATEESYKIRNFVFNTKSLLASGVAEIEKGGNAKSMIDVRTLKIGQTDMQIRVIMVDDNEYVITVNGKSFDANPILRGLSKGVDHQESVSLDVELLLEEMIMDNGVIIHDVEGHILCQVNGCKTVGIHGKLGENDGVEITLEPEAEEAVFSITSDNGGRVLRALNILDNVEGGHFATSATSPIKSQESPYEGKFVMKDFKVRKANALAKLLTVASFSGIADILNGEGISFDKMKGKYIFKDNVLKIREMKATGGSIAITVEGDVDFNNGEIKLQGNLVPATMLNKILENIPLFGFALTAGGDQSVIATRYTIVGQFTDPDVTVNPFSILTPGFLRNIWGDVLEE